MTELTKTLKQTVGVVLVNWNSDEFTISCIASLLSGSRVPDEIVVVDNASKAGSVESIAQAYPAVHIIKNHLNLGFAGGNNIGLQYLINNNIDYAWVLNNDTIVEKNCLASMLSVMIRDDTIAAVTGKMYYDGNDKLIWYAGSKFETVTFKVSHRGQGEVDSGQYDLIEPVDFFDGCSLLIRCSVLKEVGLFDEHFFAYNEDVDLSMRLKQRGFNIVYVPKSVLWHKVGSSVRKDSQKPGDGASTPLQHFLSCRNRIYLIRRYGTLMQKIFGISIVITAILYYSMSIVRPRRIRKVWAAWCGAYRGLTDDITADCKIPNKGPF